MYGQHHYTDERNSRRYMEQQYTGNGYNKREYRSVHGDIVGHKHDHVYHVNRL